MQQQNTSETLSSNLWSNSSQSSVSSYGVAKAGHSQLTAEELAPPRKETQSLPQQISKENGRDYNSIVYDVKCVKDHHMISIYGSSLRGTWKLLCEIEQSMELRRARWLKNNLYNEQWATKEDQHTKTYVRGGGGGSLTVWGEQDDNSSKLNTAWAIHLWSEVLISTGTT